jgi:LysR family transcriptional regulator, glycine cleavage system transcriptional activator
MARPLPPLNTLRAFEAAGRLLSFTKAAEELYVTPAAISHHVRTLEDYLSLRLFVRQTRGLILTPHGEILLPVVQRSFNQIAITITGLCQEADRPRLSLRLPPYLSASWLTPRLGSFLRLYPQVELRLEHQNDAVDFSSGELDLAVHFVGSEAPGISTEPLLTTQRLPMHSPSLLANGEKIERPIDIQKFTLIHEFGYEDWESWFSLNGLDPINARRGIVVDSYEVLLRATLEGQGVSLLLESIAARQVKDGTLVAPFGQDRGLEFVYYVLYPSGALERPIVKDFRQWLFDQTGQPLM